MGILKTEKDNKTHRLNVRVTLSDYYDIKRKALLYCDGNISEYLGYTGKHYVPHKDELKKGPFDMSGPKRKKKKAKKVKRLS